MKNSKLRWIGLLAAVLYGGSLSAAAVEPAAPRISLVTVGPGEIYWQRFGHNALMVRDNDVSRVYNYGMFDFRQKNFFLNFARGRMVYRLDVQSIGQNLDLYRYERRWVREQDLNLTPEQARFLAAFLADNAKPENAEYRYDYFLDNCSTRVRDALDETLGGALKAQLEPVATESSYRRDAVRLMSPDRVLTLGMDALLGPSVDSTLNLWQRSFVPMVLMDAVRTVENGGQPLVVSERLLVPEAGAVAEPEDPDHVGALFLMALALGVLLYELRRRPKAFAPLAILISLVSGLFGAVQLLGWAFTDHWPMVMNHNLLLFSPLSLALIAWWRAPSKRRALAWIIAFGALLSPLANLHTEQFNLGWIGFWLPLHLLLAVLLNRRV